jgi:hypothetical protein
MTEFITGRDLTPAENVINTVDDPREIVYQLYQAALARVTLILEQEHGITDLNDPRIDWGNVTVFVGASVEGTP